MENEPIEDGCKKSVPLRRFVKTVEDRFIEDRFINAVVSAFCKHETAISWKPSRSLRVRMIESQIMNIVRSVLRFLDIFRKVNVWLLMPNYK